LTSSKIEIDVIGLSFVILKILIKGNPYSNKEVIHILLLMLNYLGKQSYKSLVWFAERRITD